MIAVLGASSPSWLRQGGTGQASPRSPRSTQPAQIGRRRRSCSTRTAGPVRPVASSLFDRRGQRKLGCEGEAARRQRPSTVRPVPPLSSIQTASANWAAKAKLPTPTAAHRPAPCPFRRDRVPRFGLDPIQLGRRLRHRCSGHARARATRDRAPGGHPLPSHRQRASAPSVVDHEGSGRAFPCCRPACSSLKQCPLGLRLTMRRRRVNGSTFVASSRVP